MTDSQLLATKTMRGKRFTTITRDQRRNILQGILRCNVKLSIKEEGVFAHVLDKHENNSKQT